METEPKPGRKEENRRETGGWLSEQVTQEEISDILERLREGDAEGILVKKGGRISGYKGGIGMVLDPDSGKLIGYVERMVVKTNGGLRAAVRVSADYFDSDFLLFV